MDDLTLPDCTDCGHAARHHGDRSISACAPEHNSPRLSALGRLEWTVHRCKCNGYSAVEK